MVKRRQPTLSVAWQWPGWLAGGLVVGFAMISLSGLLLGITSPTDAVPVASGYLWHLLLFTIQQAALSTFCAVIPAIPLALAFYRQRWIKQRWLLHGCYLLMVMPTFVAISAIVAVYGQQGYVNRLLHCLGYSSTFPLYGLTGILLTHSLLNLPLACRCFLQALQSIDSEQQRLASQLGLSTYQRTRWLYWPVLKEQIVPLCALIFMLCFASFAIVLALGGGPQSTTLSVAIYQSLSYDYNLTQAAQLALLQGLGSCLLLLFIRPTSPLLIPLTRSTIIWREAPQTHFSRLWDKLWMVMGLGFLLLPLLTILLQGASSALITVLQQPLFWQASWTSLYIAVISGTLSLLLAILLLWSSRQYYLRQQNGYNQLLQAIGYLILALPPMVISCGLFLLLIHSSGLPKHIDGLLILMNGLLALPYALTLLTPAMRQSAKNYQHLCQALNIRGWHRWRYIDFPSIAPLFWQAFAMSCLLSLGDFSLVALFGSEQFITLPFYLYQQLGAYRTDQASATALLLLLLCTLFLSTIRCGSQFSIHRE